MTFQKWKMKSSINSFCQRDILSKNSWSKRVCNLSNKEIVLKCYKLVWWIKSDQVSKWIISVWGEATEGCDFYLKMFLRKLFLRKLKMVLGFFKWGVHPVFLFESAPFEGTESKSIPLSGNILLCQNTFNKQINQWNLNSS